MKKAACVLICLITAFLFPFKANAISAKACVVINGDTGNIIYSHNANERLPMASTTKVMTALLLCEYGNLERTVVITKEMVAVEGSSMGLNVGDTVTLSDLLYGMMLPSGNDAANAVAITLGGNIENFVKMMNEKAVALGLKDTHFNTPSGLDGESHYTTAFELALIAKQALTYTEFLKAVSSKTATVTFGDPTKKITFTNHNKLLKLYDDVIGVKTGFTKKAGRCLVSAAKKDGKFVIAVTLNDGNDWQDHRTLLDIGFSAITVTKPKVPENIEIALAGGTKDKLLLKLKPKSFGLLETENLTAKVFVPDIIAAPLNKNAKIGYVAYYINGKEIKRDYLTASTSVPYKNEKFTDKFINSFKIILGNL